MVKAVIFDLDGTLIDTIEGLADATNFALEKFSFPKRSLEEYRTFVGNGVGRLVKRALPEGKEEYFEAALKVFEENYFETMLNKLPVYDGIYEVLDYLEKEGIRKAVHTNKLDKFAKPMVKKAFGDRFEIVLGETEEFPRKPDPTALFDMLKKMGLSKDECIFVGDSSVDIETAKNAQMRGISATWGFVKKEDLLKQNPDMTADRPIDLINLINGER